MKTDQVTLVECPRDAMQGISRFISTEIKAAYLNLLLKVGFEMLDFGSFVSPKVMPQMRDTKELIPLLDLSETTTQLLAICVNLQGVEQAVGFDEIRFIGFPFSISEIFQMRNAHAGRLASLHVLEQSMKRCNASNKQLLAYISMGFGNPYGEEWNEEIVLEWLDRIHDLGIKFISLADTTGESDENQIAGLFSLVSYEYPDLDIGLHLHSRADTSEKKINAAYTSGCRRFDSALGGYGGCPMATDRLIGNLATETLINYFYKNNKPLNLNQIQWQEALTFSKNVFFPHTI